MQRKHNMRREKLPTLIKIDASLGEQCMASSELNNQGKQNSKSHDSKMMFVIHLSSLSISTKNLSKRMFLTQLLTEKRSVCMSR